jgi:hypothetical protein
MTSNLERGDSKYEIENQTAFYSSAFCFGAPDGSDLQKPGGNPEEFTSILMGYPAYSGTRTEDDVK